jgi:hypothetical protein
MRRVCSTHVVKRLACRVLVGKSEGKRPLRRPTFGLEDNIVTCRVVRATKMSSSSDDWI